MKYTDAQLYCPRCDMEVPIVVTMSGAHEKAVCGVCGKYIKFLSKAEKDRFQAEEAVFLAYNARTEPCCRAKPPNHEKNCPNNIDDWDPAQDMEPVPF